MAKTIISDKYQVVIPKEVREKVKLEKGQELEAEVLPDESGVILRKKKQWPYDYLGTQGHIWGGDEEIKKYLDELDEGWDD